MNAANRLAELKPQLIDSSSRVSFDWPSARALSRSAEHSRVHHGIYLPSAMWHNLSPEDQHLARVLSVDRSAHESPVFSHVSAAILFGLPVYGRVDEVVHTTATFAGPNRPTKHVMRHRADLRDSDLTIVSGLRCTSVERTLLDLARLYPAEVSLSAIDGFLRREFKVDHRIDWARYSEWKEAKRALLPRMSGARGIRLARQIFALADPRTDSVLESVSHLQLQRLGFEVDLQVSVPSPTGSSYYVDFEFLGLDLFGECDGKSKYLDVEMRSGLSAEQIVYREKRREEWICSTTGKRVIRWAYSDVATPLMLARRLQAFGLKVPRIPR